MANKLTIQIYGGNYPISTQEDPQYVLELTREMDKEIHNLMARERGASINQALVLAALGYFDAYKKSEKSADHLRSQIAEYLEDATKARMELSEALRKLDRLEREQQMRMAEA